MELLRRMFPLQSTDWLKWTDKASLEALQQLLEPDGELYIIHTNKPLSVAGGGKTPLLFQCAVSECSTAAHTVLITQNQLQYLPHQVHGMPQPHSQALKHLKILYMTTAAELTHYIASIHQMALLPELIVIENLEQYIKESSGDGGIHNMAKLCALLTDAATYISAKTSGKCRVLVSMTDSRDEIVSLCHRYSACIFTLSYEDDAKEWKLKSRRKDSIINRQMGNIVICYGEENDCIRLKDISLVQPREHQCGPKA